MIVCDEFHNAIKWSKIKPNNKDESKNTQQENYHAIAVSELTVGLHLHDNMIIALSATPKAIFREFGETVHEVELLGEPRHFEERETVEYNDLSILLNQVSPDKRGIIYVTHISDIIKYQKLLTKRGIKNEALWSINNVDYPLSEEQIKVRNFIINQREMPPEINVLFINKSCETCINIGNEADTKYPIDYMIIHSQTEDTIVQARGRYRNDLELLYYRQHEKYDYIELEEYWLNRKLTSADKDVLCKELGLKNNANGRLLKWPSVKKALCANEYSVYESRSSEERYTIITSPYCS